MGVEFNKAEAMPHPSEEGKTVLRLVFTLDNAHYDSLMVELEDAKGADGRMNPDRTRRALIGLIAPAETRGRVERPSYPAINTISDEQFAREFGHLPKKRH